MTIAKICPIMSKLMQVPQCESNGYVSMASTSLYKVYCLKEECESWNETYGYCKLIETVFE